MTIEKKIKIVVDSDDATDKLNEVNSTLDDTNEATEGLTNSLDSMTGGAVSGFAGILKGAKAGIVAMKSFRTAIIATGIGALVVAVGALVAYFTSTEEGANKLSVAFAAVGATVDKLVEGLAKVGKFLAKVGSVIKDVVKGDKTLREGWEETKTAAVTMAKEVKQAYAEIGSSANKAMDLQRRENQLRKDHRQNLVEEAELMVELSKERLKTDDQRLTTIERIEALNKAEKLNNEIYDEKIRQAKEAFLIQKERNALSDSTEDDLLKEAELQAELISLEADRNRRFKEQSDKRSRLLKQESDRKQAIIDEELEALEKEEEQRLEIAEKYRLLNEDAEDETEQAKIQRAYDRDMAKLAALNLSEEQEYQVRKYYDDKLLADEKRNAQARELLEKQVQSAKLGIVGQTAGLIGAFFTENEKLAKATAIVQTTISGIQGVQNAFTTAQISPITGLFPAYPYIQAGLAGGFALAQLKAISSTSTGGGSVSAPSSSSAPSQGSGRPQASAPSFNLVQGTSGNQIADTINQGNNEPVKAYVVSSEVSTGQELDRKVVDNASI